MTEKTIDTLKIGTDINAREITLTITADEAREILSALSEPDNIDLNDMTHMFDHWNPTPEELEEFTNHLSSFSISSRGDKAE